MSVADYIQTNFTAGELSPLLAGRVDVTRYQNGAKTLHNFIVRPQGGLMRRPGTRYLGQTKLGKVSLRAFQFSVSQSYVLEFGHLYVRFWQDDGYIADGGGSPIEVTTPYTETEVADIQITQSADVLFIAHNKHPPMRLMRHSHTEWELAPFIHVNGPYLPENGEPIVMSMVDLIDRETVTSETGGFVSSDVGKYIEYTRFGDLALGKIITVVSDTVLEVEPQENTYPRIDSEATVEEIKEIDGDSCLVVTHSIFLSTDVGRIIRLSQGNWYNILSYDGNRRDTVKISDPLTVVEVFDGEPSNRQLSATINCSANVFSATDVDRWLRLTYSMLQIDAQITQYNGAQQVKVEFTTPMTRMTEDVTQLYMAGKTDIWRLGAWSSDPAIGWPRCVAFYEQRLVFANSVKEPQTLWFSKSGNYEDFQPTDIDSTVPADYAITATIASNQINSILWLETGQNLIIGTLGAEWLAKSYDYSNPLSPGNMMVVQQTTHGSAGAVRQRIGHSLMFVQRSGRLLKELFYEYQTDSFTTRDLTMLSDHLLKDGGGAIDTAYQQQPFNVMWLVTAAGGLVGLTFEKDQEVIAWHKHTITGGVVESIATIPSLDGSEDQVHLSVKRTIAGNVVRYIERLTAEYYPTDNVPVTEMIYLDCAGEHVGTVPVSTISGLEYLNGQTVSVVGDGSVQDSRVVSGGSITLARPATNVVVGLPYQSLVETLNVEAGAQFGSSQGLVRRVHAITLRLFGALGFRYGLANDSMQEYNFRDTRDRMDTIPDIRSDDFQINVSGRYDIKSTVRIEQTLPYPLNILAVVHHMKVYQ